MKKRGKETNGTGSCMTLCIVDWQVASVDCVSALRHYSPGLEGGEKKAAVNRATKTEEPQKPGAAIHV